LGIVASLSIHACFFSLMLLFPDGKPIAIRTFHISFDQQEPSFPDARKVISPAESRSVPIPPVKRQTVLPAPQQRQETKAAVTNNPPIPIDESAQIASLAKTEVQRPVVKGIPAPGKQGVPSVVDTQFGNIGAPAFLHRELPVYPKLARRMEKEGKVVLKLLIGMDGKLNSVEVIEPAEYGFTEAAVEAVKKSTFIPAHVNGKKVASRAILSVRFTLK